MDSDAADHLGSGQANLGGVSATSVAPHGWLYSLNLVLPPLSAASFKQEGTA